MNEFWLLSYVVLWFLVLLEAVALVALARQIGLLHMRSSPAGARIDNTGLDIGSPAPAMWGTTIDGSNIAIGGPKTDKNTVLVFVSPTCSACDELVPSVRALEHHERQGTDVLLVAIDGTLEENRDYVRKHSINSIPYIVSSEIANAYRVDSSPYAMLVNRDGYIEAKGIVNNIEHLESLLRAAEERWDSYDSKVNSIAGEEHEETGPNQTAVIAAG